MKIVAISDTHGLLPSNLPAGDILCICAVGINQDSSIDIALLYQHSVLEDVALQDEKALLCSAVVKSAVLMQFQMNFRQAFNLLGS